MHPKMEHQRINGRNDADSTSANDNNGLCSFKCTISSIADRDEGRQTARWADGHKWTQSIKQFAGWMEINTDM